jgi:adenylate cyclase
LATKQLERQLTTVFAIDVEGYSRLTGIDEEGTHVRLKDLLRALVKPKINVHRGRVVKDTGDGILAQFDSVVDAVRCALNIQHGMAERNRDVDPAKRIQFRIGINVGDVIVDSDDIFGDDVNVAARLQSIAKPGGICVSARVREYLQGQHGIAFEDAGERQLKNIVRPVRVYFVATHRSEGAPMPNRSPGAEFPPTGKPSIAVLPLNNITGDAEVDVFCDAFSDDVIADLSRFRELFVIARHSSFAFRGSRIAATDIGKELGVRYLLEGSLMRIGHAIRVTVKLIDVLNSVHIWGESFDGFLPDILAFERGVTSRVVNSLPAYIEGAELIRTRRISVTDLEPLGYVLRGLELYQEYTREGHLKAAKMFEKAIELDQTYARAYAALSRVYNHQHRYRWTDDPEGSLRNSLRLAREAVRLDPSDPKGLSEFGQVLLFMKNLKAAITYYEKALALNPNDADVMARLSEALVSARKPEEALSLINEAIRLNPFPPDEYLWFKADALFGLERYGEVIETTRLMQNSSEADRLVAASYAIMGCLEEARAHAALVLQKHPEFKIEEWIKAQPDSESPDCLRFATGLRLAGLP